MRTVGLLVLLSLCLFLPILRSFYWPAGAGLDVTGHPIGRDFINFWAAPQIAFGEMPTAVFDLARYNEQISALFGAPIPFHMWSYPPVVLLGAWVFAQMPYAFALAAWVVGSFAVFARVVVSALPVGTAWIGLVALALAPASLINIVGGQNGFVSGALMLGALLLLDRRPILSGVLFGLLTFKPQLGLVVPLVLVTIGAWRTILAAALTAAAWYGASVVVLGLDFWQGYIAYTAAHQAGVVYDPASFWSSMMMAPMAGVMALGTSAAVAGALQIAVAAIVAVTTVLAVRTTDDRLLRTLVVVSAVPLVPHQIFNYDLPMLSAAWLMVMLNPAYRTADVSVVAGLVWLSPLLTMLAFFFKVPAVGQIILCAGFAASVAMAFRGVRGTAAPRAC